MKLKPGFVASLCVVAVSAYGVDLNKDALKSMQQEGHKIVEESQGGRSFKSNTGHCLDIAGKALLIKACGNNVGSQKWRFDDKGRLVAHDKRCVGGNGHLQSCNNSKEQKWKLDGKKRLANAAGKCLQPQGNPPKAGSKIASAGCSGAGRQAWK